MNRPCRIHFHEDAAPLYGQLPKQYQSYVHGGRRSDNDVVEILLAQNAFYIDFSNGAILRTRLNGKDSDPVDFPVASVSFVEWFYGEDVPSPLKPDVRKKP